MRLVARLLLLADLGGGTVEILHVVADFVRDHIGLRAAKAIGDDTLQRSAGRTPVPDSFTHGTSAERVAWRGVAWLKRGIDSGNPAQCDTFSGSIDR